MSSGDPHSDPGDPLQARTRPRSSKKKTAAALTSTGPDCAYHGEAGGPPGSLATRDEDLPMLHTLTLLLAAPLLQSEVGPNDFRISHAGVDGDTSTQVGWPAVAYDRVLNQCLVVWAADDVKLGTVDSEWEICAQLLDASDGTEIGVDFRVSDMGPDGDSKYDAYNADVAHDPVLDRYLVVWRGDDDSLVDNEYEVWGQLVDGSFGVEIGADFRISDAGPDGDPGYRVEDPAVAYCATTQEFLVVWTADLGDPGKLDREVFGQRILSATGEEVGVNDFQISDMGGPGDSDHEAVHAAVVFCPETDEFLVVWNGEDDRVGLAPDEREVFGQRLSPNGKEVGANDFRISDMGPDGNPSFVTHDPDIAWSDLAGHYLVAWHGNEQFPGYRDNEIFGQLLDGVGNEVGPNDFRISDVGPHGASTWSYIPGYPSVAFSRTFNEFVVVWHGREDLVLGGEYEIWGQAVDAVTGGERGENDFRVSDMGPEGVGPYRAEHPDVAYNSLDRHYVVVWRGDDDEGPVVADEFETYGQLVTSSAGIRYCAAGVSASGCQARIESTGTPSATQVSGFYLHAVDVEGAKSGLFFFGTNGRQAKVWGSGTSYQCVVPPVKRGGLLTATGTARQCDGWFVQDLNTRWATRPPQNPGAGATVQAQFWYRDPFSTAKTTTSLSDAVEFVVGP